MDVDQRPLRFMETQRYDVAPSLMVVPEWTNSASICPNGIPFTVVSMVRSP